MKKDFGGSRRRFLKTTTLAAGAILLSSKESLIQIAEGKQVQSSAVENELSPAGYTLHIKNSPIEIAPKRIISATTYNGQFPGPLLRFKEGQEVTIDIYNDTDTPEQLHWHGQQVPVDVDGAAEEGTPYIPAHGKRRIVFTPKPAGFRFYHTHNRAGANLAAGQYSGQVGPVYIEPSRPRQIRPRSFSHAQGIRAHLQPRRRHGAGFSLSFCSQQITPGNRRSHHESFARKRHAARIRSRLSFLHHQRTDARPRRARSRETRRAGSVSHPEWKRDGNSQLRFAGSLVSRSLLSMEILFQIPLRFPRSG